MDEIMDKLGYTPQKIRIRMEQFLREIIIVEVDAFLAGGGGGGNRPLDTIKDNAIESKGFSSLNYHLTKRMNQLRSVSKQVESLNDFIEKTYYK